MLDEKILWIVFGVWFNILGINFILSFNERLIVNINVFFCLIFCDVIMWILVVVIVLNINKVVLFNIGFGISEKIVFIIGNSFKRINIVVI